MSGTRGLILVADSDTQLLKRVSDLARSEGYDALSLSSPRDSTALYERYGFRVVSGDGEAVTMRVAL